jgi:hypothetical protein
MEIISHSLKKYLHIKKSFPKLALLIKLNLCHKSGKRQLRKMNISIYNIWWWRHFFLPLKG